MATYNFTTLHGIVTFKPEQNHTCVGLIQAINQLAKIFIAGNENSVFVICNA